MFQNPEYGSIRGCLSPTIASEARGGHIPNTNSALPIICPALKGIREHELPQRPSVLQSTGVA